MIRFHREATIDASPEEVWAVLSDFPNVYRWAPAVALSHPVDPGLTEGLGAGRTCEVPGFGKLTESVDHWLEGREIGYEWTAGGPVRRGRSQWSVRRDGDGTHVRVDIEATMRFGLIGQLLGHTVLKSKMGRFMDDALRGLAHYIRTGEVVDGEVAARLSSPGRAETGSPPATPRTAAA